MDEHRRKKLLRHVKAFRGLVKMVDNLVAEKHHRVPDEAFAQVRAGVDDAVKDLSDVIPSFSDADMQGESGWDKNRKEYKPAPIRGFLQRAMAACEAELEEAIPAEVVGPTLDFSFMYDKRLRSIVERDYPELLVALYSQLQEVVSRACWQYHRINSSRPRLSRCSNCDEDVGCSQEPRSFALVTG